MSIKFDKFGNPIELEFPKFLFKFCPINDFTLESIQKNYLWFSSFDNFNDPFEVYRDIDPNVSDENYCAYLLYQKPIQKIIAKLSNEHNISLEKSAEIFLKTAIKNKKANIENTMSDMFFQMHRGMGFTCLSEVSDHRLMWAHYADNFCGICIVFSYSELVDPNYMSAIKVKYLKKIPPYKYIEKRAMDLIATNGNMSPKANKQFDQEMFGTKHADWSYEKEYRLLCYQQGRVSINPKSIVGIIFGSNTTNRDLLRVVQAVVNSESTPKFSNIYLDQKNKSIKLQHFKNSKQRMNITNFKNLATEAKSDGSFSKFSQRVDSNLQIFLKRSNN